jgi:hypothetical protein
VSSLGVDRAVARAVVERLHPEALAVARHVALYEELLR